MMRGTVNERVEAVVRLHVRGPNLSELELEAVVATGFSAAQTLPHAKVAALGLNRESGGRAVLADGSVRQFDIYAAEVAWNRNWRPILVSAVGDEVLLGMRLLSRHDLRIAVVTGGLVEITPIA